MENLEDLQKLGRLYVSYPEDLRKGVEDAVDAWKAFCALPREQKIKFPYDSDNKVSGNGYELKEGTSVDLKENVHLRVSGRDMLMEYANRVDSVIAPTFVEKALALNELMAPTLRTFAEAVEKKYSIPGFTEDVMIMQPTWLIRFIHYFGDRKAGDEIATPHNDKGGFTLHLYESDSGVERLDFDTREWVPMPLSHDQTVIIAGNGLQQRSRCQLRALSHRVVANEETAQKGRFSAVCFFTFRNARYFDKTKFGSQQAWAPGTFYDMPFEEFNKLFVD